MAETINHVVSSKIKTVPPSERITYTWNNIDAYAKPPPSLKSKLHNLCKSKHRPDEHQHILRNVCGVAYPGELLAILGSSGAGKTSLLNALTFRTFSNITVTGERCINGILVTSKKTLTSRSAYVQQEDLFIGNLTVKEHLMFQAWVRMDKDTTRNQKTERVGEVIVELGLSHCQHSQIGIAGRIKGISGGEIRRLSFAAEVLTNPKLMFCDEPTSGLDSYMALNVMQLLKMMARSGKTVVCTIHQPSSDIFLMFDKLLLMAEGRTAFLGSLEEASAFFNELGKICPVNYNPGDFYMKVLAIVPGKEEACRETVISICESYKNSELGIKVREKATDITVIHSSKEYGLKRKPRLSAYKVSWWSQLRALLWRSCLTVIKEPLLIRIRLLQTSIMALIIGITYFGQKLDGKGVMNINGVLFIYVTSMTFQNVVAVINVFCGELPVFLREHHNGMYRTDVYFISKTVAETPAFIIVPTIFTAISYYMIGLRPEVDRFFIACGILILVANVATSFGYLISCMCSTVPMALALGPPLIIPFLIFGGFLLNIESVPFYFKWISWISWFRFGMEALMINQWHNLTVDCPPKDTICPKNGAQVLDKFSFSEDHFFKDIMMLVILIVAFRIIAFFALLSKTYQKK